MKVDQNGNIIFIKVFANTFANNRLELKYFYPKFIYFTENSNIIFNGKVLYGLSSVSYSVDSYIDQIIFSMDYNGNMNWISVFDYRLNIDNSNNMIIYDSVIYSSTYGANYYPGFFTVNETDGTYIMSNFFTYFTQSVTDYGSKTTYWLKYSCWYHWSDGAVCIWVLFYFNFTIKLI